MLNANIVEELENDSWPYSLRSFLMPKTADGINKS